MHWQAVNGLMYGYIMKVSSNVTRLFVITASMLLSTGLSMHMYALASPAFAAAIAMVLGATVLYNHAAFCPATPQ